MPMDSYVDQFLAYLRLSRNASELTCKSYGEDISQFIAYARDDSRRLARRSKLRC